MWARNWSRMADDLPALGNYIQADEWYEKSRPFTKGEYKGERPLGNNRRYGRMRIAKDADGAIVIKHYKTDIMKYYPDGGMMFNGGGWDSISSAQTMQELLVGHGKFYIVRKHTKIYYVDRQDRLHLVGHKGLHVSSLGEPPTNPLTESVYKPRKEVLTQIRNKYKPFTDYVKNVLTMNNSFSIEKANAQETITASSQQMGYNHTAQVMRRIGFFETLDACLAKDGDEQLQEFYNIALLSTRSAGYLDYSHYTETHYKWKCPISTFKTWFDHLIKYQYSEQIFELKEVTSGKAVKDSNWKYIAFSKPTARQPD